MNFSASLLGLDQVISGLKNFGNDLAAPAADAAAESFASTVEQTREADGLTTPLERSGTGARREVGASDPVSVAREFGTLEVDAAPWLAPSLPAAQGPMRAAVVTAAARAISTFRFR